MATAASTTHTINVRGQGTIHACTWRINYPFDDPSHELTIPKLRKPHEAVITLQVRQPDSGHFHDYWVVKIIDVGATGIHIRTRRLVAANWGEVVIHGIIVEGASTLPKPARAKKATKKKR